MANAQIGNLVGFVDRRESVAAEAYDSDSALGVNLSLYRDRATLESTLAGLDPATYTADVLRSMTQNDLVYAVRSASDPSSI